MSTRLFVEGPIEVCELHKEQFAILDSFNRPPRVGWIDAERRMLVEQFAGSELTNRATNYKQQLGRTMLINQMTRSLGAADHTYRNSTFSKCSKVLDFEAGLASGNPTEISRIEHDRLVVARRRIFDFAPIDVFPDRFVTILADFS